MINEIKQIKQKVNQYQYRQQKLELQKKYQTVNKEVKKSARTDKWKYIHNLIEEAENSAGKRDMKALYNITKTLSGKKGNLIKPVKDKNGKLLLIKLNRD
jgi:phage shock protein A